MVLVLASLLARPAASTPLAQLPDPPDTGWEYDTTIPDSYEQVGANANFALLADPASLGFKVVDLRSGYIWHATLDEVGEDDRLNRTWTAFASSGISINYMDLKATEDRASITNAEHTMDYQTIDNGFQAVVTFTEPSITVTVQVVLEESGVSVSIPFDGITEADANYRLSLLYVYPFFAAAREDQIPGYMFMPDGSGSLVRFRAESKARNMFYGRYYGDDLGMLAVLPFNMLVNRAFSLAIPVSGMVHGENQNAYISIVEKGASYGELQMHPSGVTTNFNFLYSAFVYNQSYFQATNRSGAGVTTLQRSTNNFDVLVKYRFLTGDEADYVGMARSYRQYLLEKGALGQHAAADGKMGIRLEFLAGERERVLLWNRTIPMTTIAQMREILNGLQVQDPQVIYYGWQPRGASAQAPTTLKLDAAFGTLAELRQLAQDLSAGGGRLALYNDPQAALYGEGGYSSRRDLAMAITNTNLLGYNRYKENYYFDIDAVSDRLGQLRASVNERAGVALALDNIGSRLYADFQPDHVLNREQAIARYQEVMAGGDPQPFYLPNDYMFPYADAFYDVPLSNSGYLYTDEVIPFLQIVLAGSVPVYGPALNFSSDIQTDLLRHADFGVAPSFFITYQPTSEIINTASAWIYSSSYTQWSDEVNRSYAWLNAVLGPVAGAEIIGRQVLARGVNATTYSNGKQVIVNYNAQPYRAGNVVVGEKSAVIVEVIP